MGKGTKVGLRTGICSEVMIASTLPPDDSEKFLRPFLKEAFLFLSTLLLLFPARFSLSKKYIHYQLSFTFHLITAE